MTTARWVVLTVGGVLVLIVAWTLFMSYVVMGGLICRRHRAISCTPYLVPTHVVDSTRALVLRLGCLTPTKVRALAWDILDRD